MTELLLLLGVAVLVAANGFFVAAEFGLVRARQSRIEHMRDEGRRGAALALHEIDRIDEYLSACQLGITMASLGIGFMGEPAIASLLEDPLGNVFSHGVAVAIAIAFAYFVTTSLHITVGEQVPKIYSIVHAEGTARRIARPLYAFRAVFKPFIWLLNTASNWMLRLVGVNARAEFEEITSSEDLKLLIAQSAHGDWWVRGHVPIPDLVDYGVDLPVDSEAFNSVGGYIFGELGRLPKRGDMVQVNGYSLRVESVRENRIEAVRIRDHDARGANGPRRPVQESPSRGAQES